ncbi:MAG: glycosyltransferase family 39 protein [Gemmatimonadales bacterium]
MRRRELLLLAGLAAVAVALRFWRLGDWNFQATEMFTLRDSHAPQFGNWRPLGYLLNYYGVRPFLPLDEFGLRLLPAIFGVLAIPAFYFVARRLAGTRAALFGTLFLALSPLLVMYSQLARYWSLVFLLSAVYPYAVYWGVRERDRRALALGLVTGVLAALAHPVSMLLVGGLLVWFLVTYLRPSYVAQLWRQKYVRWTALLLVILAGLAAVRFIPMLQGWISQHDRNPGSGQFLLQRGTQGLKQILNLAAYVESLTAPLALSAVAGIYLLWKERDRSLALFLTALAVFPIAFITLVSLRTPVSLYYLLPAVPVFFIGAGVFLDRLFQVNLHPRWLLPSVLAATVIAAGAPTLISEYRDGRRYDFRTVAHWLEERLRPGDFVFSDQAVVLAHYLPGVRVERLRHDTTPLKQSMRVLDQSESPGSVWIVAPAPSHARRTNLKRGGLIDWIYDNCRLRNSVGVGRFDFRQNYLQIYRCLPVEPGSDPQPSKASTAH